MKHVFFQDKLKTAVVAKGFDGDENAAIKAIDEYLQKQQDAYIRQADGYYVEEEDSFYFMAYEDD